MAMPLFDRVAAALGALLAQDSPEAREEARAVHAEYLAHAASADYVRGRVEAPKSEPDSGPMGGECITHPSFAVVSASRVSGQCNLFGSYTGHQHYITLRVAPATLHRNGYRESIMGGVRTYVEVAMSEAQWAAMIGSMNHGSGVPCTLQGLGDPGVYYRQAPALPSQEKAADRMASQIAEMMARTRERSQSAARELEGFIGKLPKRDQDAMRRLIESLAGDAESTIRFQHECLTKTKEKLVADSATEIDAMLTRATSMLGVASMQHLGAILSADPAAAMKLLTADSGKGGSDGN